MSGSAILQSMFGTADPGEQASRLIAYKAAIEKSHQATDTGGHAWDPETKTIVKGWRSPKNRAVIEAAFGEITKAQGLTPELQGALAQIQAMNEGEFRKDWTPTNPIASGLVPYDLEAPAKELVPLQTPLRNTIPRERGQGNARQFKTIDSFTNAGITGGAATVTPFFNSGTATSTWGGPGNLTLNRPAKISYTGANFNYSYVELGFSDQVNFRAQFQGIGFDDLRGLSHHAALWSHLHGEERAMLYGRGATGGGYSGIVAAPSTITTGTATTGGTIAAATYFIYVAAVTGFGQSAVSTVVSQVTTGATSTVTVNVGTEPTGALYYNLYVGTTTGIANATLQQSFIGNSVTIASYSVTATTTAGTDSSFDANAYDGFLTVLTDPARSGYFDRVNAPWSTTNPGSEFDTALATMWQANRADPDEIWMTGIMRKDFAQLMRIGNDTVGAASGYRTTVTTGPTGAVMGAAVTGYVNPLTTKLVDLRVHPFMPDGSAFLRSTSLPVMNSEITAPAVAVNVQDYMAIDWPTIQMTYDVSTYQMGTLIHYAPRWSGALVGVQTNS